MKRAFAVGIPLLLAAVAVWIAGLPRDARRPVPPGSTAADAAPEPPAAAPTDPSPTDAEAADAAATAPDELAEPAWVPDPNGFPIAGRVVDEAGAPVAGAEVRVYRHTAEGWMHPPPLRTDDAGEFRIEGLPDGLYRVRGRAPLYAWTSLENVAAGRTDLLLTLRTAGQIAGRLLLPDGTEAPEPFHAWLTAERWDAELGDWIETSGEDPESVDYAIDGLPAGRYRITAVVERVGRARVEEIEVVLGETTPVDIPIAPGAVVEGRLVAAETGEPVAGALVVAGRRNEGPPILVVMEEEYAFVNRRYTARSDADGRFRIPCLPEGACDVAVRADGFRPAVREDVPAPTGDPPLVIELSPGGTLEVLVLDAAGKPVVDVTVDVEIELGEDRWGDFERQTDDAGRAVFADLPPGETTVDVSVDPWFRSAGVVVEAGATARVTLREPEGPAVLTGTISRGGRPLPDHLVVVYGGGDRDWLRRQGQTDADGRYRIEGLPADPVEISLQAPDYRRRELGRRVLEAGANPFDVDLPGGRIVLDVVDAETGDPVPGARAIETRDEYRPVRADERGRIELANLPAGPATVVVSSPRHAPVTFSTEVGDDPPPRRVGLKRAAVLSVYLLDENEAPLANAWLKIEDAKGEQVSGLAYLYGDWDDAGMGLSRFALAPGEYTLTTMVDEDAGYRPQTRKVTLPPEGGEVRFVVRKE